MSAGRGMFGIILTLDPAAVALAVCASRRDLARNPPPLVPVQVAGKSTGIIFTRRPTQRMAQEVTIHGEAIEWSNNVKYLGVHFDRTMTWGHHVAETIRKAKIAMARFYPLLCGESATCGTSCSSSSP
ncbi:hypothetical protein NQ315_000020 [Exocentrus adspersus]|uniref:Uncharacterized protein n=1 Tax=Exocentrus adspersus TaxID=1586481 RepID=A0AAV8VFN3_9CUCU|nr:hypothetical protein NQ315_000020 [Exocentrus adspersus]